MIRYAIETKSLSKRFKGTQAVDALDLQIEPGCFYTLLGPNGAGKTTTIKMLLGILQPDSGSSCILGTGSSKLGVNDFRRIGYVSETQKIHKDMSLHSLINFLKPQYPNWDDTFCNQLIKALELPLDRKLKTYSRGMLLKAKLLTALAYHPNLLIMDEPFSGLDPVVRQESIDSLLEWAQDGERTVFISSHDIDDVEPISERIGILQSGKLTLDEDLEQLKARTRRIQLCSESLNDSTHQLPSNWIQQKRSGRMLSFVDTSFDETKTLEELNTRFPDASNIELLPMSLKETYIALAKTETATANSFA